MLAQAACRSTPTVPAAVFWSSLAVSCTRCCSTVAWPPLAATLRRSSSINHWAVGSSFPRYSVAFSSSPSAICHDTSSMIHRNSRFNHDLRQPSPPSSGPQHEKYAGAPLPTMSEIMLHRKGSKISQRIKEIGHLDVPLEVHQACCEIWCKAGVRLSGRHIIALIRSLGRVGLWREAVDLLGEVRLKRRKVKPPVLMALVEIVRREGQWGEVLKLMKSMRQNGYHPNTLGWSESINAASLAGAHDHAAMLVEEQMKSKQARDVYSFTIAINVFLRAGRREEALEMFDRMRQEGVAPNHITYLLIIKLCSQGKTKRADGERAWVTFQEMRERGVKLERKTYQALFTSLTKSSQWQRARELLELMEQVEGWAAEAGDYYHLVNACARVGEWKGAKEVFESMTVDLGAYSTRTHNALLRAYANGQSKHPRTRSYPNTKPIKKKSINSTCADPTTTKDEQIMIISASRYTACIHIL